jgi:hypothetical protein
MRKLHWWILGLFWLGCAFGLPLRSDELDMEQEVVAIVKQQYPVLRQSPLAVLLVSTDNCAGCSAIAINHAITALHSREPRLPCIVAIITPTHLEATTIRERFFTPYVIADTLPTHATYALKNEALLPRLIVFDSDNRVVFRQEDIRHTAPNYAAAIAGIVVPDGILPDTSQVNHTDATRSLRTPGLFGTDTESITLEEPTTRSVRDIISPVIAGANFAAINYLTGQIEQWDISNGMPYPPVKVPDTVTYFYRRTPHDRAWQSIEKKGYEMARFEALTAVDDTVYALVKLLAGYTVDTVMRQSDSGALAPFSIDKWQPGQVIVRMEQGEVKSIVPVPNTYTLLTIADNANGYIGGICSNVFLADTSAGDSVAFVVMIDKRATDTSPSVTEWKVANNGSVVSAGTLATAPDAALWYCDPMQSSFFLLYRNGNRKELVLRGTLRESGSPIRFLPPDTVDASQANQSRFAYLLDNVMTKGDTVFLLLIPEQPSSGLPCILQSYTTTGRFLGEQPLHVPMAQKALWIHLLAIENNKVVLLLNTQDKRWHIQRTAIDNTLPPTSVLHSSPSR